MDFIVDQDLHIHSKQSLCSRDPEQTAENILSAAKKNGLKTICLTDHFWDETVEGASEWYQKQDFAHICEALPLPEDTQVKFLFGCETDLDRNLTLGLARENFDRFDFVIIPTTHLHMKGFTIAQEDVPSLERRAELWASRLNGVLDMDLPFEKVGIAHLTCSLMANETREDHLKVIRMIPRMVLEDTFERAASKGVGIELNFTFDEYSPEELEILDRVYLTAKRAGCKFYCGSDAHHPGRFLTHVENMTAIVRRLGLSESDKFVI